MEKQSLFKDIISVGSQVTAKPDSKVRGGKAKRIFNNGDILFEYYGPTKKEVRIKKGKYQLSKYWNNSRTRKNI